MEPAVGSIMSSVKRALCLLCPGRQQRFRR
jgi:hypothetical protein